VKVLLWGNLRERQQLETLGVDYRIILNLMFKKYDGDVDLIYLVPG
jgi:hypothetical protein